MIINQHNYESILIDYFDGVLSEDERHEVMLFLDKNPEIAEQFEDFENTVLSPEEIIFENKDNIHIVSISNKEFEIIEKSLPQLKKDLIIYPHKHILFQKESFSIPKWVYYAAAACFAVILVFLLRFDSEELDLNLIVKEIICNELIVTDYDLEITDKLVAENRIETRSSGYLIREPENLVTPHDSEVESSLIAENTVNEAFNTPEETEINGITDYFSNDDEETVFFTDAELIEIIPFETDSDFWDFENINSLQLVDYFVLEEESQSLFERLIINPFKSISHSITRLFFERKTEVELFIEEQELTRFFARR